MTTNGILPTEPERVGIVMLDSKTAITGSKVWEDGDDQDGIRPEEVTLTLVRNGVATDVTTKATKEKQWTYAFSDLDVYDDAGAKYVYTVKETPVKGYQTKVKGTTVINTHVPEEVEITLTKKWADQNDKHKLRPGSIEVSLLADEKAVKTVTVTGAAGSDWKASFGKLPVYKDGKEITYTVEEAAPKHYTARYRGNAKDGFTITNTLDGAIAMPKTGDRSLPLIYAGMAVLAALTLVLLSLTGRKARQ